MLITTCKLAIIKVCFTFFEGREVFNMQFQQLEYIIEVTKTGSISEAAKNLHVSTATVSQSISNLEKEFGVEIFSRSRTGTKPTEKGKIMIEKAFEIRNKWKELENEAFLQTSTGDKKLKIVSSPSPLLTFLPEALAIFKKNFPYTDIEISENQNVISEMLHHETDIGFLNVDELAWVRQGNTFKNILHFSTLFQGIMYVCTEKDSHLAQKDSVTPEELLNSSLILHDITKPVYDDISNQYGTIKILFESSSTDTILKSVANGLGISFLSEFSIKNHQLIKDEHIVPVPLVNYERSNLTCGYIRSKKRPISSLATELVKIIRENEKHS